MRDGRIAGRPRGCPARDCAGGFAGQQRALTERQRASVLADVLARYTIANPDNLMRCDDCGMVYERAVPNRLLGHFEQGDAWRPLPLHPVE